MLFQSFRAQPIPWSESEAPDWVGEKGTLDYEGATITAMAGTPPMVIPAKLTLRRRAHGPDWACYEQTWIQPPFGVLPEQNLVTSQVCGPAMFGSFWLAPAALAELRAGQVLDRDPAMGSTISVTAAGKVPDGRTLVTIEERAPRYTAQWTYDMSVGVLAISRLIQPGPLATTTSEYFLRRMR